MIDKVIVLFSSQAPDKKYFLDFYDCLFSSKDEYFQDATHVLASDGKGTKVVTHGGILYGNISRPIL